MSYDIYIGEAKPYVYEDEDDRGAFETVRITVERMTHPEAPTFPNDGMTGNGNSRHPGYSQWSDFARSCGLHDVLVEGWIKEHPGSVLLTRGHIDRIKDALSAWRSGHPDAVPGFARNDPETWKLVDTHYDAVLARLIWLEWWCEYALANCRIPTVYNH